MIHLREDGVINGAMQRFPLGSYPMRKNQVEEIGQFIEDFFEHPDPGSWTKNLHWRYPLWSDIPAWLIGFDLYPFPALQQCKDGCAGRPLPGRERGIIAAWRFHPVRRQTRRLNSSGLRYC